MYKEERAKEVFNMKRVIEIDSEILSKVKKETGNKTDRGAVVKALNEFLEIEKRRKKIRSLKHSVEMK